MNNNRKDSKIAKAMGPIVESVLDDYTKNRSPRFIWLKLGNDWYGNTNFKFEKEMNEKMLGVLETISRGRNEKQNMLSSLKRIGKEIKI